MNLVNTAIKTARELLALEKAVEIAEASASDKSDKSDLSEKHGEIKIKLNEVQVVEFFAFFPDEKFYKKGGKRSSARPTRVMFPVYRLTSSISPGDCLDYAVALADLTSIILFVDKSPFVSFAVHYEGKSFAAVRLSEVVSRLNAKDKNLWGGIVAYQSIIKMGKAFSWLYNEYLMDGPCEVPNESLIKLASSTKKEPKVKIEQTADAVSDTDADKGKEKDNHTTEEEDGSKKSDSEQESSPKKKQKRAPEPEPEPEVINLAGDSPEKAELPKPKKIRLRRITETDETANSTIAPLTAAVATTPTKETKTETSHRYPSKKRKNDASDTVPLPPPAAVQLPPKAAAVQLPPPAAVVPLPAPVAEPTPPTEIEASTDF